MIFKEFVDKKSTHIVIAILIANVIFWFSWTMFKSDEEQNFAPAKRETSQLEKMAGRTIKPEHRDMLKRIDSLSMNVNGYKKHIREKIAADSVDRATHRTFNKAFTPNPNANKEYNDYVRFTAMQKEIDSLKTALIADQQHDLEVAIAQSSMIAAKDTVKPAATSSSLKFVFDNATTIFSIVSAIPVTILKWENLIAVFKKKKHNRVTHRKPKR